MRTVESEGVDITEPVQILYDIAHSSMDWGSGLLDNEEMAAVVRLAVLMGWEVPDLPDNSPAMHSVALEFPEQYEIVEVRHPERVTRDGYVFAARTSVRIKRRPA